MSKSPADTPLMQQHRVIKARYPDAILLFRVGDFYETFGEDAILASGVLGITLTRRNNGAASSSELAGFPHHALDTYLHKLVRAGYRVAVCDQLENPKAAKGIVKRGVTEMITPGLTTHDKLLDGGRNNFLAGYYSEGAVPNSGPASGSGSRTGPGTGPQVGLAFLDITTGEFLVSQGTPAQAEQLLQSLNPAEVVFSREQQKSFKENYGTRFYTYPLESWIFTGPYTREILQQHFQTHSLKGFGIEDMPQAIIAAGAILHYLKETEHPHLQHLVGIQRIDQADYLLMDRFTIRNLELYQGPGATLRTVLNQTASPMGARLLERWLVLPSLDPGTINGRLDGVEYLILNPEVRQDLRKNISECGDIERMVGKVPTGKINPREILHLEAGLEAVARIAGVARETSAAATLPPFLASLCRNLDPCPELGDRITKELEGLPPIQVGKGPVFRPGVHAELDRLRSIASDGKGFLLRLQVSESEATGIPSLKVSFNNIFGYYLEVTNAHKTKVPAHWIRKQTLTGAERYITPELKEYEETITGAEEKILSIETALYAALIKTIGEYVGVLQANARTLATLDVLAGFAENALKYGYHRPQLHDGRELDIREGRHPVMERLLPAGEAYIPNDVLLGTEDQQIIILTGPNMSGKSALLRQTALITLMAHMGSFVPARSALIPLTDKIFTRVGASDNLNAGESTFMVEMNETASILNNISPRSLVLLDEIGRGTATYDGISIAWSIVEYLRQSPAHPKTFFATHYHELNDLEEQLPGVRNYHISNKEAGNKVIFLRRMEPGGSTHSFGIHVARMAGMPPSLVARAGEVLRRLEGLKGPDQGGSGGRPQKPTAGATDTSGWQLSIFDAHSETFEEIRRLLIAVDIDHLTPVEALLKLSQIKGLLK